jgi:FMN phosphatase YigB (HAD superfamily)
MNRGVKHLLVDLDGTLLGNNPTALAFDFARRAFGNLRPHGGIPKVAQALLAIRREFRRPSKELTNDVRVVELFARHMGISPEESRKTLREGVLTVFPKLEKHFYPLEGAKEFIDWAKDRYSLTLATNPVWPPEAVELRVRWAGLDPAVFGTLTHIRKMRACKPEPQYYQEILDQQGYRAEDCLLIGNDLKMDLPATRVGIRVFIIKKLKRKRGSANESVATPLPPRRDRAQAWRGSYPQLKTLLESL